MSKKIRKIVSFAAPIIAPFALGPAGLGLTGAGLAGASAAVGAGAGALSGGGLKSALLGGIGGGLSGSLSSSGLFGNAAGTTLDKVSGIAGMQGPTLGSGLNGALTGGGLGNLSSYVKPLSSILSGVQSYKAQDDMEEQLAKAQGRSEAALSPYTQAGAAANSQLQQRLSDGFNPGDLTQDPGYQFRMNEGQTALDRSLAASGMRGSGTALKAAQEYGQGVADQTYNDAYRRWLEQNQQLAGQSGSGLSAANSMAGVYDNQGNIAANAIVGKNNVLGGTLSQLLSGSGARQIIGYDQQGNPIYAGGE